MTPTQTPSIASLADMDLAGKRVLIREDFNVPIRDGTVANAARLQAALPTIEHCMAAAASVCVVSHLGRPSPGQRRPEHSLAPVAAALTDLLGRPVQLLDNWRRGQVPESTETVGLLENIRFEVGETDNDPKLAADLAGLCDVFVMDAFGTAHRAHASTCGVIDAAPLACAGLLLAAEVHALDRVMANPAKPLVVIVGGAKVSTKLAVLESLAEIADTLVVGGGIANTFLGAAGAPTGRSLAEPDRADVARRIMNRVDVPLPVDVMTAAAPAPNAPARLRLRHEVSADEMILDIGPETARQLAEIMESAGTILWNGPLGMFELDQFGEGTRLIAEAIAASSAFSVAGGGDTISAIDNYDVRSDISYISTGGGAFLEYLEGKPLPAIAALRAQRETLGS